MVESGLVPDSAFDLVPTGAYYVVSRPKLALTLVVASLWVDHRAVADVAVDDLALNWDDQHQAVPAAPGQ